eukprot:TRINITY_DN19492_c0_g1_i1.p1 TRINITY_DN19492_c0_g1~~TRINITY_DN19492_c0_g1_i1.p1  ORF type:complete len:418 (+),score=181.49 TRINITY_DN19492_c0_g1_i1:129-1382(+)
MGKGKKDKVPAPGKFPKTKKVEKECKGKWASWLKTKMTIDFLSGRMVEWDGAMVLAKALEKNIQVTSIDFSYNNIQDQGCGFLALALKTNNMIRVLNLSANNIGDGGGLALASSLMTNRALTDLNFLGNDLTCNTAQAFGNVLKVNLDLAKVNLSWNRIGARGARALMGSMEQNQLCVVELGGQTSGNSAGLGDDGCRHVCDAFKKHGNKDIHNSLNLWHNDIGKLGGVSVGDLLCDHELIRDINLSWNSLGSDGVASLVAGLLVGKTVLRTLSLMHNIVGDIGAKELARVLEHVTTLERLTLSYNMIGDSGAEAIANAVGGNKTLKHLDLSFNNIGSAGGQAFVKCIQTNQHLATLYLQKNNMQEADKTALSEAMRSSQSPHREPSNANPVPLRVNYGAADDDDPYADLIARAGEN